VGQLQALAVYITELAPAKKRGYIGSFANVTTVAGVLLATITAAVVTKVFSQEALVEYGWRIPFYVNFLVVLSGYYIRLKLPESFLFSSQELQQANPFVEVIKNHKLETFKIFCYVICIAVAYYTFNVFSTAYLASLLKLNYLTSLYISIVSILLLIILIPIAGYFSDVFGRKKLTIIAITCMIVFIYPVYIGFSQKILWLALMCQFIFAILIALYLAPLPAMMAEQVKTKIRCSSVAFGYNLSLAVFGGTAPIINIYLIKNFESNLAPGVYLAITGIVSLVAVTFMKDRTGKNLSQ